jgi:Fe-S-cluster containining protein
MPEPHPFADDVDTVAECTGACCDPVTMWGGQYRAMSLNPKGRANARYILNMLTARGPVPSHGVGEFDCRYFNAETRRCTAYDRRPKMCRDFPVNGECHFCGGRFPTKDPKRPPTADAGRSANERGREEIVRALMDEGRPPSSAL